MAICKACGTGISFVRNPKTGKKIPVEPEWLNLVPAVEGGKSFAALLVNGDVLARARRWSGHQEDPLPVAGRVIHFSTCPRADQFRRRATRKEPRP
jgi:hypothetical protein